MCDAFSCVVRRDRKVFWKRGLDSHSAIEECFGLPDNASHCKIEIKPRNGSYVKPDRWMLKVDQKIYPDWLKQSHLRACESARKEWWAEIKKIVDFKGLRNPVNPFSLPKRKPTKQDIKNLKEWISVVDSVELSIRRSVWGSFGLSIRRSVGDSVADSVGDSVADSVRSSVVNSVRSSVGRSVWDSVWDSVYDCIWAYIGSFFKLERSEWKHTEKVKFRGYPFASAVRLWKRGLVPSFDRKKWSLHSGEKAEVVYESGGVKD